MNPTCFSQLVGNSEIKCCLEKMLEKKAVANSMLFAGPEGVGKSQFAYVLASKLICAHDPEGHHLLKMRKGVHPDLHVYRPEGKLGLHTIQSLRELGEEVHLPPYEAQWKVFIIHEADRMLSYSANALLKTFEEPPSHTLIILVSDAPASIIPTILSRCRTIRFQTVSQTEIENFLSLKYQLAAEKILTTAQLAQGSLGRAVHLAENCTGTLRTSLLTFISNAPFQTYKELSVAAASIAEQVENTRQKAEENAKGELCKVPTESLTALQQQAIEKELEGISTLAFFNEAQSLFAQLLSWYRDLEFLQLGGNRSLLLNRDHEEGLERALQRGHLLSISHVQTLIAEAQLSLQRSTSLTLCLENLFLKLGLL